MDHEPSRPGENYLLVQGHFILDATEQTENKSQLFP